MKKSSQNKNVTVYLVARLGSVRTKDKNIRDFAGGLSLFEIMCKRMKDLTFPYFAAVGDAKLIEIAKRHHVPVALRSKESLSSDGPLRKIFEFLENCETTHASLISPCTPFLEAQTINKSCAAMCQEGYQSITSVTFEQNWYFGRDQKPLFPIDIQNMNSKALEVYAMANAFEIFPVERFLKEGIYYTFKGKNDPFLYRIPKKEAYDINSEEEFEIASYIWRARHGK